MTYTAQIHEGCNRGVWSVGCYATVAEIQGSFLSMTKHSMTGIQALNIFLFEPAGLRA